MPEAVFLSGVFAYDVVDQFEPLPKAEAGNDFPDYVFYLADRMIFIDHMKHSAQAIVCSFGAATEDDLDAVLNDIADSAVRAAALFEPHYLPVTLSQRIVHTDCSNDEFARRVLSLKKHIVAGDVFQIVLSRSLTTPCRNAFNAYRSLRAINHSPYMFYMNDPSFTLFGASPESAVKVDGSKKTVEISPIAGTRRRGFKPDGTIDFDLDSRIEAELRLDEKENAEHMMLVDLARNDVARVSKPNTRFVTNLMRTERYSHVMHLVSRVAGELRDEFDALHAYQASMNMGTLTGAPKIRAMQLLRKYEGTRRGHYGGAIGYLSGDGSLDTAIVIRSALVKDGIGEVRAGAGIVQDSDPNGEAEETYRKAEAVLYAIALSEQHHD
jgi:anthranilate synthase component 1